MFEMKNVVFDIGSKRLLHSTNIQFAPGKVHGLIGHNGSGKSTLLKLLAQQNKPTAGVIEFDGQSLASWRSKLFARQVAYLPQHLPAGDNLTGRELIAFGRYPWHGLLGQHTQEDAAQVERAYRLTQTEQLVDRLVDTLSGGEKQRVWLAMLIAQGSRFLLLDEPLAALDIAHQAEVLTLIQQLSRELGLGIIIVLHDINMAARYCDNLVALHSGRILAQGTPADIMRPDTLAAIYGIAMHIVPNVRYSHPIAVLA